ncbi:integral membrane protein, YccS/YhfK family [Kosakonia oryzendophytica]|uniref:Integral membrane protein, YccS/YhfK family n=1 Tax=Kosakonia oryzendophytica TaxID=1005665 RepID=A0A1C4E8M1_9ENTR|nr:YccS/YhfK family putative transporter [Kosakonia oryzendophytica]AMO46856.1 YccS/YhfK family integral membrane protein [Enterobacter sp. FY-07]WBT58620.1 YccS/YhfK family putative transporter [Kosakonia oryzendophytica]SCC39986.1 integral membrane protein, YccS/YhfK family [Kosakonia oryzendophytica]
MWRRLIYHPEINYALRQTLVLCLPVAIGLIVGHLQQGLLFSLVPACCNIAGLDTPHKRFFKRLIIGGSLFAGCSLAVQLLLAEALPLPLIFTVLTLLLGVTAEISALHGRLLPASLIAAIFTLSLAGSMPVWEPLLIYALGTLWYGAFNWFWFWMWREQPLRESLSLLYRQLADYCEAKYSLLTQHADPEKALPPLLARQQKAVDMISTCYQQLHMLAANQHNDYKRLLRVFQMALDLQEHISVSLHQPEEVQKLVEQTHAEQVIRWNAQTVSARLRVLADDILYHRYPTRFTMDKQVGALEKIARQHPENPVGQFCAWHFSRIARVLRTQRPLYLRDLMAEKQRRLPLIPALKSYLSLKSAALRNAARISVMLSIASLMGSALHLPKPYWIMMTIMFVTQNGYGATRVRIVHRAAGTLAGLMIAGIALHFHVPLGVTLAAMLLITLISYLIIRKNYGWAMVGFTITAVYTLQLLTLNGEEFIVARLIDTLLGCLIAFGGMVWLWPQWQSGLLRQNAHDALETYQEAIRLILSDNPKPTPLAWQRMRVNQAHNALFNSLNQAMLEPGFNTRYLEDMKLWVTHSQFIVEHINAMTTLAREHTMLTPDLAQRYLQSCEIALQRCQQRLEYDGPGESGDVNILEAPETLTHGPMSTLEQHLQRVLGHLNTMHTISSVAWRQRPHHGIWLTRSLRG